MAYISNKDHHVLVAVGVWFGVFLLAALSVWLSARYEIGGLPQIPGRVCTQEAMLCSDGSYVSRTGPNCEFAKCPMSDHERSCLAVITSARNKDTGECKDFPSSCLPPQYVEDRICEEEFNKKVGISSWQTYRNEEYGFEVKYQKDWRVNEIKPGQGDDFLFEVMVTGPGQGQGGYSLDMVKMQMTIHKNDESGADPTVLRSIIMKRYGGTTWPFKFPLPDAKIAELIIDNHPAI